MMTNGHVWCSWSRADDALGLPSWERVRIPLLRYSARAIQLKWNHVGSAPQIGPSDSQEPDIHLSELSPSFSECAAVDFTISAS